MTTRHGALILGSFIDALDWEQTQARILLWAARRESRYVCICNVHAVVTAARDATLQAVLNTADMATPDGAPVAWMLRRLGYSGQQRINGPDLTWKLLARAEAEGVAVYFYGSRQAVLDALAVRIRAAFPRLSVAGMHAPPFRPMSDEEDAAAIRAINDSGAGIVFIGLGCPRQERWMAARRGAVSGVMIGVGAAFDFHAGTVRRAPQWMQDNGLEWLHRLCSEPRRLWKRYLVTNTLFVLGAAGQLVLKRKPANIVH